MMKTQPNGWNQELLSDYLETVIDYRGKTPKKSDSGILTLSAKSVKMGEINYNQAYFISQETYDNFMVRGFPQKGDILMTTEAPLGCIAKLDRDDVSVAQRLLTLRTKKGELYNNFLMYYLMSSLGQYELGSRASGSTVQGIKRSEFEKIKILLPSSFQEQKAIADILSSFDKKIELLKEQNKTLETMAQTIFKEWFVNFNYPNATGEMIDSEMGEIPKGWRVCKIGDIVDIYDSQRIPLSSQEREIRKGSYPYYGATKVLNYIDDFIFDGTYLLFAEDGSVADANDKPILQYVWGKFWVNNHTHILRGKNGFSTELLYIAFKNINVSSIITGAVQLKINQGNLLNYKILIPDKIILNDYIQLLNPIFRKFKSNFEQIKTLEETRDSLLPKLMSGQKRVFEYDN